MSSLYLGRSPLGFPRPLNFGLNWLSAHKAFIALELSQTYTKLTFPVAGLQHLPQCQVICCPSNHFLSLKQSSWNLSKYLNLEKSQLKNFAVLGIEPRSSPGGLRPYPLRFHVKQAGADAKLIQHGPLGVTYHRRHPISTVPVARITAHATVPSNKYLYYGIQRGNLCRLWRFSRPRFLNYQVVADFVWVVAISQFIKPIILSLITIRGFHYI